jgi:hypothetical protein
MMILVKFLRSGLGSFDGHAQDHPIQVIVQEKDELRGTVLPPIDQCLVSQGQGFSDW